MYKEIFTEQVTCDMVFRNLFQGEKEGENILTKKMIINTCIYARSYNHTWNIHRILRMFISLSLFFFFFLLHCGVCGKLKVKVQVAQSCRTLCDPMDYTVCGILQARILEWVAVPFSRGSSQPRDRTQMSHIAGRFFTS